MLDFDISYDTVRRLVLFSTRLKDDLKKYFKEHGHSITTDQYAVLRLLWNKDGQSQVELGNECGKDRSNITRILDTMEKNNLIVRQSNPGDRRKFCIYLTEYASSLEEPLNSLAAEFSNSLLGNSSPEEVMQLTSILDKMKLS